MEQKKDKTTTTKDVREPFYQKATRALKMALVLNGCGTDGNVYLITHKTLTGNGHYCSLGNLGRSGYVGLYVSGGVEETEEEAYRSLLEEFVSHPDNPLHVSSLGGLIMKLHSMGVLDV